MAFAATYKGEIKKSPAVFLEGELNSHQSRGYSLTTLILA